MAKIHQPNSVLMETAKDFLPRQTFFLMYTLKVLSQEYSVMERIEVTSTSFIFGLPRQGKGLMDLAFGGI